MIQFRYKTLLWLLYVHSYICKYTYILCHYENAGIFRYYKDIP